MKLQCTSNSICLRLRKSEIGQLLAFGKITERIDFPSGAAFEFSIGLEEQAQQIDATFQSSGIHVVVPLHLGNQWGHSEMMGLEAEGNTYGNQKLLLLIEKDTDGKSRLERREEPVAGNLKTDKNTIC